MGNRTRAAQQRHRLANARQCGGCTLCCSMIQVRELNKPALTACPHQCQQGCAIYEKRPASCTKWMCAWLAGEPVGARPDESGFVIDASEKIVSHPTLREVKAIGVYVESGKLSALDDEVFRSWLDGRRVSARVTAKIDEQAMTFLLSPPSVTGRWERTPTYRTSMEEIRNAFRQGRGATYST